jgi:hypothetical protein
MTKYVKEHPEQVAAGVGSAAVMASTVAMLAMLGGKTRKRQRQKNTKRKQFKGNQTYKKGPKRRRTKRRRRRSKRR